METVNRIQPIINGSFNPRLTTELFAELNLQEQRQVIWNIMVSLGFAHSFPDVDYVVFEPCKFRIGYDELHSYSALDTMVKLFVEVRKEYEAHHNKMMVKTANHRFVLGKKIHQAQKELGFGGWIELDKDRMQGYITEGGSWNDFKHSNVSAAIGKIHDLAPRKDYGPNNPNTGAIMHKWKSVHRTEYVVLEYEFVDGKDLERIKEFYKTHWEPKGRAIKADSIRTEVVDHGQGYWGIELIWWWD